MDAMTTKLDCLRLAVEKQQTLDAAKAVAEAEAYWQRLTSSFDRNPSLREDTLRKS
jgi:hypothetical protein